MVVANATANRATTTPTIRQRGRPVGEVDAGRGGVAAPGRAHENHEREERQDPAEPARKEPGARADARVVGKAGRLVAEHRGNQEPDEAAQLIRATRREHDALALPAGSPVWWAERRDGRYWASFCSSGRIRLSVSIQYFV